MGGINHQKMVVYGIAIPTLNGVRLMVGHPNVYGQDRRIAQSIQHFLIAGGRRKNIVAFLG